MKIQDLIKFPPLHKVTANTLAQLVPTFYPDYKPAYKMVNGNTTIGIEVEVENLRDPPGVVLWELKQDGSLRNHGHEYVTAPIPAHAAELALKLLYDRLPLEVDFSRRTSTHVHMNIRNMEVSEVCSILLLYLIFEPALFKFVGQERDKNIHCVPIRDTNFVQFIQNLELVTSTGDYRQFRQIPWQKYTALNLAPTTEGVTGTLEFRHMHGTRDIDKMLIWINLILSLKTYAQKHNYENVKQQIYELNSNSLYRQFANEVFTVHVNSIISETDYFEFEKEMEEGILQVKTYLSSQAFLTHLIEELRKTKIEKSYVSLDSSSVNDIMNALGPLEEREEN